VARILRLERLACAEGCRPFEEVLEGVWCCVGFEECHGAADGQRVVGEVAGQFLSGREAGWPLIQRRAETSQAVGSITTPLDPAYGAKAPWSAATVAPTTSCGASAKSCWL
jgi:hypothetical protein